MSEQIELPNSVPVMPLPGALLFPHALLPLFIFEPRYRAMLARALSAHRMFCVALVRPGRSEWRTPADFHHVSTVGLIRACVERADGTSNLILQGLHRVAFARFRQEHPFPIAEIAPLASIPAADDSAVVRLSRQVLDRYREFKRAGRQLPEKVDEYLSNLTDPEMLSDLVAATFVTDASRRQKILEELDVEQRLRLVLRYLRDENGEAAA